VLNGALLAMVLFVAGAVQCAAQTEDPAETIRVDSDLVTFR
jgi:hypothetical protein